MIAGLSRALILKQKPHLFGYAAFLIIRRFAILHHCIVAKQSVTVTGVHMVLACQHKARLTILTSAS